MFGQPRECNFDELIAALRAEGHVATADLLDDMLHHTAWTTGSELRGELMLALRAFKRRRPTLSKPTRQLLQKCLKGVSSSA